MTTHSHILRVALQREKMAISGQFLVWTHPSHAILYGSRAGVLRVRGVSLTLLHVSLSPTVAEVASHNALAGWRQDQEKLLVT